MNKPFLLLIFSIFLSLSSTFSQHLSKISDVDELLEEAKYLDPIPGINALSISGASRVPLIVINRQGQVVGYDQEKNKWSDLGMGDAKKIAIDINGNPWIIKNDNSIYWRKNRAARWFKLPGKATEMAIGGDGTILVIGISKRVFQWNGKNQKWDLHPINNARRNSGFRKLGITPDGGIYVVPAKHNLLMFFNRSTNKMDLVPNSYKIHHLAIGKDGSFYALREGKLLRKEDSRFVPIGQDYIKNVIDVAVDDFGAPYILTDNNVIYAGLKMVIHPTFRPKTHGYRFQNRFDINQTVELPGGILQSGFPIKKGYGLCGGMALGVKEHFLNPTLKLNTTEEIPRPGSTLHNYLSLKLKQSFGPNNKFAVKTTKWWMESKGKTSLPRKSVAEYEALKKRLQKGELVVLYMQYRTEREDWLYDNHQVLAYGYSHRYDHDRIYIYEPNRGTDRPNQAYIKIVRRESGRYLFMNHGHPTYQGPNWKRVFGIFPGM